MRCRLNWSTDTISITDAAATPVRRRKWWTPWPSATWAWGPIRPCSAPPSGRKIVSTCAVPVDAMRGVDAVPRGPRHLAHHQSPISQHPVDQRRFAHPRLTDDDGGVYRDPERPFALVVGMNPPHMPYDLVPDEYVALYADLDLEALCQRPNIPPVDAEWGDYDADGDFDLLIQTGSGASARPGPAGASVTSTPPAAERWLLREPPLTVSATSGCPVTSFPGKIPISTIHPTSRLPERSRSRPRTEPPTTATSSANR